MTIKLGSSVGSRNPVLLITPSRNLGGGIERFGATLQSAFETADVNCKRVDLDGSGILANARLLGRCKTVIDVAVPVRIVLMHRSLLPIGTLLARAAPVTGISVVCHGTDVWGRPRMRRFLENNLMCRQDVRVVAVSGYTAGALAQSCRAIILPPGLSRPWFKTLVAASETVARSADVVRLVTAFRLADWQQKGLPTLLAAISDLHRSDVKLTVCGSGMPSQELEQLIRRYEFCSLRHDLSDSELAGEMAAAQLFVLATRTRSGRGGSGEGFGMVLLEAQVAGTAVVAPASGGTHDAYVDGMTGIAPVDETVGSLAGTLEYMLRDRSRLLHMGASAAVWARGRFAPERYSSLAVQRLL